MRLTVCVVTDLWLRLTFSCQLCSYFAAFSKRLPVSLYIKMVIGDITKTTSVNDVRCSSNVGVVFDDLKHFLVTVNM